VTTSLWRRATGGARPAGNTIIACRYLVKLRLLPMPSSYTRSIIITPTLPHQKSYTILKIDCTWKVEVELSGFENRLRPKQRAQPGPYYSPHCTFVGNEREGIKSC
jgi:hypothetical protein